MPAKQRRRQKRQQGEFHLFGQLPTELRLQIWAYTWEPRTVSLYAIDRDHFLRPGGKNLLPASAYVNYESRKETLRYYKRCFAHPDKSDFRWFNFRLDTLCLAANLPFLNIDPNDLKQVQRLIVPDENPGTTFADTPCRDTWPEPVTQSFESPVVEALLEIKYPSLKELTLTANRWRVYNARSPLNRLPGVYTIFHILRDLNRWNLHRVVNSARYEDQLGNKYTLERDDGLGEGWGHMRTTYISGLKVRHSPSGRKTYQQRYCCKLSEEDVEALEETVLESLL
ncbi:hypothetical protein GQX73_g9702 [Xylaria multiplex]|uniref:2EXR domain-containing protein n=1 Tax=Xylaria multiplex TaxID=323545 RepID=A0A7C8IHK2_9PEZI|nr:hypothetical protein GQX73_g9702 [Xylaria multiplex]